jgi:hypothetical protein
MDDTQPAIERRGWFAVPKGARDAIRLWYDGAETCATALAVFDALAEVANDKGVMPFVVDQPWLAGKAGCSTKTIRARLHDLEQVGVVVCVVPKLKGPATFTIAALQSLPPFGNNGPAFGDNCRTIGNNGPAFGDNCRTIGNNGPAFGKEASRACLPTTEEQQKNEGRTTEEAPVRPKREKFTPPPLEECRSYAREIGMAADEAEHAFDHYTATGWRIGNRQTPMKDWQAAFRCWNRRAVSMSGQRPEIAGAEQSQLPLTKRF